jgi:hypothetical protein
LLNALLDIYFSLVGGCANGDFRSPDGFFLVSFLLLHLPFAACGAS